MHCGEGNMGQPEEEAAVNAAASDATRGSSQEIMRGK